MTREEVGEKLRLIIRPYVTDDAVYNSMNENSDLLRDLKVNSAHLIDIVLDTEKEFDITIEDDLVEKMTTVKDAIDMVFAKIS